MLYFPAKLVCNLPQSVMVQMSELWVIGSSINWASFEVQILQKWIPYSLQSVVSPPWNHHASLSGKPLLCPSFSTRYPLSVPNWCPNQLLNGVVLVDWKLMIYLYAGSDVTPLTAAESCRPTVVTAGEQPGLRCVIHYRHFNISISPFVCWLSIFRRCQWFQNLK